jgi:hypothetical protein
MKVTGAAAARADVLVARANAIAKQELIDYVLRHPQSERAMARAERVLPLGVAPASSSTSRIRSSCAAPPARTSGTLTAISTSISHWGTDRCSPATPIRLSVGPSRHNSITARST